MSKLLLNVKATRLRSLELIPAFLEIYDDKIVFRDKGLLSRKESTISYKQVSQVSINKGLVHSTLEVINTGGFKNIKLEHVNNKLAVEAKRLIEQYVHEAHTGTSMPDTTLTSDSVERLAKLKELLSQNLITKEEFEEKRKEIISNI